MDVSPAGRAAITRREGRLLTAYPDSVGVWTIGVGHTGRMAPPKVTPGMTISAAQSDAFLAADLGPVEIALNKALKVPVTQNEFDALASLFFNVGTGWLPTSGIIRALNLGDVASAAAGFDAYHRPAAIIGRRDGEKAQFLTADPTDIQPVTVARAGALAAKAGAIMAEAKTTAVGGGAVIVAGAAVASVTAATSYAHWGWIIAGAVAGAAIVAGIVWALKRRIAATLATNAAKQASVAGSIAKPPATKVAAIDPAANKPEPTKSTPAPAPPSAVDALPHTGDH